MHLAIYDEFTKRKALKRNAVAVIHTDGSPKRRTWSADISWQVTHPSEYGESNINNLRRLRTLVECLQNWEHSLRDIGILSPSAHMLVFAHFQIQRSVKTAFAWSADPVWEFSDHSVHFPTRLLDAYGELLYA